METRHRALAAVIIVASVVAFLVLRGRIDIGNVGNNSTSTQDTVGVEIQYEQVNLQDMLDELDANALRAEETYQDKYVEVTGEIKSFDSDGKYISIVPCGAPILTKWVSCDLTDPTHKAFLLEKNVGDVVTIRGKVDSIGEIQGYDIDIIEISD